MVARSTEHPQDTFGQKKQSRSVRDALERGAPTVDLTQLQDFSKLDANSITETVIAVNSFCQTPRLKFICEHLVRHLHALARDISLTTEEWMAAIEFLTAIGKISTPTRQEFILLSDILGLSALVDSMNHPVKEGSTATESSVLGPFHVEESPEIPMGGSIASEGKGEYMYISGRVLDTRGQPIPGCLIDTWEGDTEGFYDTQYEGGDLDCRGRLRTDASGNYFYRLIRPSNYPVPNDGPVGDLCRNLNRHVFRPAHLHMMIQAEGFAKLVTALYMAGDEYLSSDAVFGAKKSLTCEVKANYDDDEARAKGFPRGPFWYTEYDFVLQTKEEAEKERRTSLPNFYKFVDTPI